MSSDFTDPQILATVVIPCFNLGVYLREAVDSVRAQTLKPIQIIVVNDGSTEKRTLSVLLDLEGEGVQILHTTNLGLAAARNFGISHARGKYILPLDADDRIAPGYLEAATKELESNPQLGIVYGLVECFGERSGRWALPEFSSKRLLYENMIVASSVFRRKDWKHVGGYRETMRHGWEDWDFWLSLVERGRKVLKLPEVVFYYRIRQDSMTRLLTKRQKLRMFSHLVRNHPRLYALSFWPVLRGLACHSVGLGR